MTEVYLAHRINKNQTFDLYKIHEIDIQCDRTVLSFNRNPIPTTVDNRKQCLHRDNTGKFKRGAARALGLTWNEIDFHLKFSKGGKPFNSYHIWF